MRNLLQKLFKRKAEKPDNRNLLRLLELWADAITDENYEAVARELICGNNYLLIPTVHDPAIQKKWGATLQDITLRIQSIRQLHGKKVLGVFSTEATLNNWGKGHRSILLHRVRLRGYI